MSMELAAAILNRDENKDGRGHLKPIFIEMDATNSIKFKDAAANSMIFRMTAANIY